MISSRWIGGNTQGIIHFVSPFFLFIGGRVDRYAGCIGNPVHALKIGDNAGCLNNRLHAPEPPLGHCGPNPTGRHRTA